MKIKICIYYLLIALSIPQSPPVFAVETNSLLLSKEAIGPIKQNTPYNIKLIQKLLPQLEIKQELNGTEGEDFTVLVAYKQHEPLLTIVPEQRPDNSHHLLCISFTSNDIKNNLGPAIGTQYSNIYKHFPNAQCFPGPEEMSSHVICPAPNTKNIFYVFAGSWPGPDGTVPPINILQDWYVKQITWFASEKNPIAMMQFCRAINLNRS